MSKIISSLSMLALVGSSLLFQLSCKKDSDNNTPTNTSIKLTTADITSITSSSAIGGGNITEAGGFSISLGGICWSTSSNPDTSLSTKSDDGDSLGVFTSQLNGLTPSTKYFVRAYAVNSKGLAYGDEKSFTTLAAPANVPVFNNPLVSPIASITSNSAQFPVVITSDGGSSITSRGVCWNTSINPTVALSTKTTNGTGSIAFTASITGLAENTTYYARAYATNMNGTTYGKEWNFKTPIVIKLYINGAGVTDVDGNTYKSIIINGKEWMKENLKVTKYKEGTPITTNLSNTQWKDATNGAYAIYNNDAANNSTYGKLYNFYAVANPKGLCPTGWHVSTDEEFQQLENFLGGADVAGAKMRAVSTLWTLFNQVAVSSDSSGFSGLPGGQRNSFDGAYYSINSNGYWWTSTESSQSPWLRTISLFLNDIDKENNKLKSSGYSVRCIKD